MNLRWRSILSLVVVIATGCLSGSCRKPAESSTVPTAAVLPTNAQVYKVKGVIRELKMDGVTAVIQHEEIPGYMPAMTMPLEVKDPKELTGLQAEDQVSFRMIVTPDDGWIDQVKKTGRSPLDKVDMGPGYRRVRDVDLLKVGDLMPDYPFTNEVGRAIRLSDFRGSAVGLTFIFTRCPFPDFCPRMTKQFNEAVRQLTTMPNGPANWHLFSISFDPAFDTPTVLKAYAEANRYDPQRWSFVTGAMIDIDAITDQFELTIVREGAAIDHKMRTVVIDRQGRIQQIFVGNSWTTDQFVAEMVKAAKAGT